MSREILASLENHGAMLVGLLSDAHGNHRAVGQALAWLDTRVDRLLFAGFDVRISGGELFAQVRGEPVDVVRHAPAVEVKGATLTELGVRREADGSWRAQCVIDV